MPHPVAPTRRQFLRGMGVTLALPWLESLATASRGASTRPPVRTAMLFMPNGVRATAWTPVGTGADFELSPILAPLASLRDDILVVSGLQNAPTHTGDGHYVKTAGFLTGATIAQTTGADLDARGISLDQVIAQRVGRETPLPSLELSVEPVTAGVDTNVGYTRLYGSHISWSTPRTPVAREISPRRAFDRLFRTRPSTERLTLSILDEVTEDARRLRTQLGQHDQRKVDEYLESVRAIEKRVTAHPHDATSDRLARAREDLEQLDERITTSGEEAAQRARLMIDLILLAFQTDVTRVATLMFGNAVSNRNFSFLDGVSAGHHEVSHHQEKEELLDQYERIAVWHVTEFAYMLARLKQIREGEGSLLDHTTVMFGSGLRDGNRHDPKDLPIVIGGRGGGYFRTGRHLACPAGTSLSRLHLDTLAAAGLLLPRFGDADAPLVDRWA